MSALTIVNLLFLLSFAGFLAPPNAGADRVPQTVIVSASRLQMDSRALTGTTILTREQITRSQASDLPSLIKAIPGVHLTSAGGAGSPVSLSVRGAEANHTLILVDGTPVNNPTDARGGSFDLYSLQVSSIESIEITRGAGSAVHGSDALAATINIITRKQDSEGGDIQAEGGNADFYSGSADLRTGDRTKLILSGFGTHDGNAHSDRGDYTNSGFNARIVTDFLTTDAFETFLSYNESSAEVFPDDSGGGEFSEIDRLEARNSSQWRAGVDYDMAVSEDLLFQLKGRYYDLFDTTDSPQIPPGVRDPYGVPKNKTDSSFERLTATSLLQWNASSSTQLILGTEVESEDGESRSTLFFPDATVPADFSLHRNIYSSFIEVLVSPLSNVSIRAGGRLDKPDHEARQTTASLDIAYQLRRGQSVSTRYARGFKLPSFFALGHPIVGNEDLSPERSHTIQAEYRHELPKGWEMSLRSFYSQFKDAIVLVSSPSLSLINDEGFDTMGGELELTVPINENLQLTPWTSYTRVRSSSESSALFNRPRWQAGVFLNASLPSDMRLFMRALYTDSVLESSIPTGNVKLSSYFTLDTGVSLLISDQVTLQFSIDNLLDRHYTQEVGVQADGIRARLGGSYSFS
jgi:outer membrane cobalamin receptor